MGARLTRAALAGIVVTGFISQICLPGKSMDQTSKLTWDKDIPQKHSPPPKHGRHHTPPPPPIRALTVQYRLIKRGSENVFQDTNADTVFYAGDKVKIGITPNQDGYLYIINGNQGEDGDLVFPDSRINDGQNFVRRNTEYIVPGYCPNFPDPKDCWYKMDDKDGREEFTLIFSRGAVSSLSNDAIGAGGKVAAQTIKELRSRAAREIVKYDRPKDQDVIGKGRYVIWVQNQDARDNKELIFAFNYTHRGAKEN
jgi:hypothetical protein